MWPSTLSTSREAAATANATAIMVVVVDDFLVVAVMMEEGLDIRWDDGRI